MWLLLWLGSFVATLAGKDEQLCDSCIISLRPEATPTKSINTENGYVFFFKSRLMILSLLFAPFFFCPLVEPDSYD